MDTLTAAVSALPRVGEGLVALHPDLWRGHQFGRHAQQIVPSGFALLDAQLPGGGWPRRSLTELLLPHPGVGEIRLLSHCLTITQRSGRPVMLFDPPAALSGWALVQLGLDVEQLLIIVTCGPGSPVQESRTMGGNDSAMRHDSHSKKMSPDVHKADEANLDTRLWALEQALKSGQVGAVLAWLPPRLRIERLRRLQLAAHAHDGVAFVLREMAASQRPSAAPLRLALRSGGADVLAVHLLKRRGPPLEAPLQLALSPVLSRSARQRERSNLPQAPILRPATFVSLA
jgi:protein ImuA